MWLRVLLWVVALAIVDSRAAYGQMVSPPVVPVSEADHIDARLLSPALDDKATQPATTLKSFACSAKTLAKDTTCIFVGEPTSVPTIDRRRDHAKAASAIAQSLCDEVTGRTCTTSLASVEETCALVRPPTDERGRFVGDARACYFAMRNYLDTARSRASVADCCQCAAMCGDATGCDGAKAPKLEGMCVQTCAAVCGQGGQR